jgi:mono/diheme cytochrome c family protein
MILRGLVLSAAFTLAAASAGAQSTMTKKPDAQSGLEIAKRWCQGCHVIQEGQAAASDAAPPFEDLANDPARTPAALRAFLAAPQHPMPPVDLTSGEIADLVAYIQTLKLAR